MPPVFLSTMKLLPLFALSLVVSARMFAHDYGPEVTEKFSKTYPLSASGTVDISNMNGSVQVEAWDKNEVSLEAEKFSREADGLKRIEIVVDSSNDRLVIKTKHHRNEDSPWWSKDRWSNNGGVRYKLKVPAALAAFRADVMNSKVTIDGVRGDVRIKSMNGRINATGFWKPMRRSLGDKGGGLKGRALRVEEAGLARLRVRHREDDLVRLVPEIEEPLALRRGHRGRRFLVRTTTSVLADARRRGRS